MNKFSKVCSSIGRFLRANLLIIFLITGLILGLVMALLMRNSNVTKDWTPKQHAYFRVPGELLLRMLKGVTIPFIVTSLIAGMASLDFKKSGKLGVCALLYYISTTLIAVVLGLLLVSTIKPGKKSKVSDTVLLNAPSANVVDSIFDLLRNIFPDNIFEATFTQVRTKQPLYGVKDDSSFELEKKNGVNALGLVVFSLLLGVCVSGLGEAGLPFYRVCDSIANALLILVTAVIWYSPIGLCFLLASEIIQMKNPMEEFASLGWYMLCVLSGLFIHATIILPLIYFIIVRQNPYSYLSKATKAFVTAFGTASSSATLPVTYHCLEEKLGMEKRLTRFMLPVGATINMDGTALYEAVASIFIAQLNGMDLDVAQVISISLTSTLASIGAASIPQAGLVTMVMVLGSVGLPPEEIVKILAVDWLLDRFRTAVNVEGDVIGVGVVSKLCRNILEKKDETGFDTDMYGNNPEEMGTSYI